MRLVFETCEPRPEVLSGDLQEDMFAARLKDVIAGSAPSVYQQPETFFENTYPTAGLRFLLQEVLGRLTGKEPANNPVIRLETAFGGGKTHNLIALYHAACGVVSPSVVSGVVDPELLPQPGQVQIAGVVGSDLASSDSIYHVKDDVRVSTLWGELAYQLGGRAGYALARESDHNRSAPGTGLLEELVGKQPTLIMLDELARYMRAAQSVPTATGKSDLAEQTVAFLMSLLEFAVSRPNVVVVLTLASSNDAFSKESAHLREQLADAQKVIARQERVITPTGEAEIAAIVRHRLFSGVDSDAAEEVARAYAAVYRQWHENNETLPSRALTAEYAQEIITAYPFHPELLNALTLRIATIPNFQKTRGALRLLALVVRALWERRPGGAWLIHPHYVDLRESKIVEDLTSRLDRPAFKQVVEADIVSPKESAPAHAFRIDQTWTVSGRPPYARNVATTVFLHSLTQSTISGIAPGDLLLAVIAPGDDPHFIHKAAEQLYDKGWFFEWDGHRYRFKPEPSINKIVADEMGMVSRTSAKQELDGRVRRVWKSGDFKVVYFPQESQDVDDDARQPKLVVLHFDAATSTAADPEPPELAQKIMTYSGSMQGYRKFPNHMLFLVADEERVDEMVQLARRYLAIMQITGDGGRMEEFTPEQRKKLKKLGESAELEVRVGITKAYRHFYYPSSDIGQQRSHLAHEMLPAQEQGEVQQDQSRIVLRVLRNHRKALTGNEQVLAPAYVKSRAWDTNQVVMTTEDLRKGFARRLSLPVLFDLNQLKKTILQGIKAKTWVYYDARAEMGYDYESPPPAVQITDEAYLYLPEEAERLDFPIKGKIASQPAPQETATVDVCPVCGNPVDRCTCSDDIGWTEPQRVEPLVGNGVPRQAFEQLFDRCQDQEIAQVAELRIRLDGTGLQAAQDMRALGVSIPQLNVAQVMVDIQYVAEFEDSESLVINMRAGWDRYRQLKNVTDALSKQARSFTVGLTLVLSFPDGLALSGDRYRNIHELLTSMQLGPVRVEAEALRDTAV